MGGGGGGYSRRGLFGAVVCVCVMSSCFSFHPKSFSSSYDDNFDWSPAIATWYGNPNGAGSDGGSCGYGKAVEEAPFGSLIAAGGPSLYKSGKGCGACYQVKCSVTGGVCSGKPVTVVITDSCPGGGSYDHNNDHIINNKIVHFDLSGTALGAMAATAGLADHLRNLGVLHIQYKRVGCNYPGTSINFVVDSGSNPNYFATLIEYEDGDGDLGSVELKQNGLNSSSSSSWIPMKQSWGAVWKLEYFGSHILQPPFSLRLTSLHSANTLIANSVIPVGWQPGHTYTSLVNFHT